ncbi:MAG TPA: hypothetical protein PKC84_00170 [Paracoccaceae bacterium]|nr:hypothetical protein [Paracoccaceae bacterium]
MTRAATAAAFAAPNRRRATAAAAVLGLVLGGLAGGQAVRAQDWPGGLRLTFGVEQGFEYGRNLALETPPEGTTVLAVTRLSFGLDSGTRDQRLQIDGGAALRLGRAPGDAGSTGLVEPELRFSYNREGARAALNLAGSYTQRDVAFLRGTGEDLELLTGTGQRSDHALSARLELGRDLPFGLVLNAGRSGTGYSGTSDPGLFDLRRDTLGATARLAFGPLTTGRLTLRRDGYAAEDAVATRRRTSLVEAGLAQEISPALRLDLALGQSEIRTTEAGLTVVTRGLTGRAGLVADLANGTASVDLDATLDTEGAARRTLTFGRSLELARGALSARLGVTWPEGAEAALVGGLDWRQDLPDGSIALRLDRSVGVTSTDETRVATVLALDYSREINAVSGFGLGLSLAVTEATATDPRIERSGLTATWRRSLTEDWGLTAGARYQTLRETGQPRARAPSVFLTIGRQFEFRP